MGRPQSTIKICSGVMLDNTYQNTIFFDSLADQKKYFEGKVVKTFPSYSYLRRDWDIVVQATMEEALSWTYLFFYNAANAKTYYYFIKKIQYENDNAVRLFIEMDVMQTYAFDYTLASSFVEREHAHSDEIGEHLLDEGLDVGELISSDCQNYGMSSLCVLILSSFDPEQTTEESTTTRLYTNVDGVFSGLGIYAVCSDDFSKLGTKLQNLDAWGKSDGIISMWMYPQALVRLATNTWDDDTVFKRVAGANTVTTSLNFSKDVGDGYKPKNNKLLVYPFNFLYAFNNLGSGATYHFEKFADRDSIEIGITGSISPEGNCKMYPKNYDTYADHYDAGLLLGNYPTCAWNQDVYKLWVAQNQNQMNLATASSAITIGAGAIAAIGSLAIGNVGGAVGAIGEAIGGASQIANILAQKKDMEVQPPQSKGNFSASVNITIGCQCFEFARKHVDEEHARAIDDYFTMYGYKCNRVKIPNTDVRENFTYTKTIGCNVYGNLCIEDLTKIKSIFDKGVTFWKQGDLIGNYNLSNACMG